MQRATTNADLGLAREPVLRRFLQLSSSERKRELTRLGITKSRTSDLPVWLLAVLLIAAAAVAVVAAATHSLSTELAVGMATAVITVAGLLVAVLQWRAGLAEKALDALYQRIAFANKMRVEASKGLDTEDEADVAYRFFVFTEIDSLEYATVRYRFGLGMSALIADRAVQHFRRRCEESPRFHVTAEKCAADGAYLEYTKEIVEKILADVVADGPDPRALRRRQDRSSEDERRDARDGGDRKGFGRWHLVRRTRSRYQEQGAGHDDRQADREHRQEATRERRE